MISGQKAAHLALQSLGLPNALDGSYVGSIRPELILAAADAAEIADAQIKSRVVNKIKKYRNNIQLIGMSCGGGSGWVDDVIMW